MSVKTFCVKKKLMSLKCKTQQAHMIVNRTIKFSNTIFLICFQKHSWRISTKINIIPKILNSACVSWRCYSSLPTTNAHQKLHILLVWLVIVIAHFERESICFCYSKLASFLEKNMICRLHSHLPFSNEVLNVFIT